MALDTPTRRPALADDDEASHRDGVPADRARDRLAEAPLAIQSREHRLHVWDDGLRLDDEDGPSRRMPGERVHGTSFATDGEGDFGLTLPTAAPQESDRLFDEVGVLRVEKALE